MEDRWNAIHWRSKEVNICHSLLIKTQKVVKQLDDGSVKILQAFRPKINSGFPKGGLECKYVAQVLSLEYSFNGS